MSEGMDPTQSPVPEPSPQTQSAPEAAQTSSHDQEQPPRIASSLLAPPPIAPRPKKAKISQAELLPPPPGVKLRPAPRRHFPEWSEAVQQGPTDFHEAPEAQEPEVEAATPEPYDPAADGYTQEEIEQAYAELAAEQAAQMESTSPSQLEQGESDNALAGQQESQTDPAQERVELHPRSRAMAKARPASQRPAFSTSLETANPPRAGSSRKLIFAVVGIALLAGLSWWKLGIFR